ncbi:DUF1380 family protein [Candidatus Pantoea floridensis]|uniref:DUF1380 domain-containing protein n=1 Tax=Candidatus Pantoea floridensis TaxID=1938870 RepID=A0A286DSM7_9GAMM|nr:DUF1380 family protein [Pantoea floridensis]PIF06783.1 uncharacterized protein DUF1380 [Enterobacteriaceae bacterium JKS000233]SOD61659.1 Protein of unknown function [Pantoea floridensis]
MHGNVNEICAWLLETFQPDSPFTILVWTEEDVQDCTDSMALTEEEGRAVLAEICELGDHQRYGIGRDAIRELACQVRRDRQAGRHVTLPAASLAVLLELAGKTNETGKGTDAEEAIHQAQEAMRG